MQLFKDRFEITNRILGVGGYGSVFAAIHKKSHRQLACKVVNVEICFPTNTNRKASKDVTSSHPEKLAGHSENIKWQKRRSPEDGQLKIRDDPQFREFEILKDLDHPNIIRLEKVFWSINTFYIFQELVTGGDLFSFIESKGSPLSDIEAAVILRQILKAIEYIHDRDIVHRDLKPDNILVTSTAEGARIVVTDFGNARYLPGNDAEVQDLPAMKRRMFTVAGTLEYVAPEVHSKNPLVSKDKGYTKAVDMWSIGSITAALLTGDVIFVDRVDPRYRDNPRLFVDLAARCDLSVLDSPYSVWQKVGKRPKDLVKKLLVLDETKRLTATQALAHDWFTNKHYADELDAVYQRSIEGWTPRRKIFRLVEALDLSRLAPDEPVADVSTSRYFPSDAIAPSQLNPTDWYKSSRKLLPASLPKIEELDENGESEADVHMAQYHDVQDSESFDVQESMSQLAINSSEASTDLLVEEEEVVSNGDRTYPFDADHEMAVGCTGDGSSEPLSADPSVEESSLVATTDPFRSARKRQSSPRPDDADKYGVESLGEAIHFKKGRAKRLRVD
ncbi:kinase-like protein [Venturia nashicola]|nr:kinase-like protein [Venturia nashicola]